MTTLDDAREFLSDHVVASNAQLTACVAYAAATHAIRQCVTFGRMLFTSELEESGKTLAMMATVSLCSAPLNAKGSAPSLASALAAAGNEPEKPVRTLYRDEISDVTGRSGLTGSRDPVLGILREGYKRGATDSRSVNRVPEPYSIFTPFLMTGLRTAVPRDIRSRCIVITMQPGKPRKYFDVREAEPYAAMLASALSADVKRHADVIGAFRARGLHPRMLNRKLEVWEPLCAVAYTLGGSAWLADVVTAFGELALDEPDRPVLTPRQQVIHDVAAVAASLPPDDAFAGGLALADELRRIDHPLYAGRTEASVACLIRDSLPLSSEQRRIDGVPVRGYPVSSLLEAWERAKPADYESATEPVAEVNPFDTES